MNGNEVLVDTSVWVALFSKDPRVAGLADRVGARTVVASALTLAELQSLSAQGRLRLEAAKDVLATARIEVLGPETALEGGRLHGQLRSRGRTKAGLVDALILATSLRVGAHLLTLDHDLAGEPGVEVLG